MADFKAIETFLWVVTLGSFRGAAQKLNTTQPAISQRIAQLEREMGVQLLQRDRRAIAPTPAGRRLMLYAEKLIGLRSEMLAAVGDRSEMRGVLRLGVAETIVHTWLSQLIKSVNHAYPNLTLEIEVDITSNLRARLLATRSDCDGHGSRSPINTADRCRPVGRASSSRISRFLMTSCTRRISMRVT